MCLQFLRIWSWTIAKAAEKKIYYNLWIVQPTLYLSPETKFSKATTIKKWVVKLFICFYRPPCATHCAEHDAIYKWEQWWMGQFGLMWRRSWEEGGGEWRGRRGQHVQTDTPLQFMWQFYVIFLTCCKESHSCHFDWPIKHSNLWSWSCQVQLWFQTPPQSSWSQQAVTWLLWRGWLLQLSSSWSFDDIKIFCAILDTCPVIKVLS